MTRSAQSCWLGVAVVGIVWTTTFSSTPSCEPSASPPTSPRRAVDFAGGLQRVVSRVPWPVLYWSLTNDRTHAVNIVMLADGSRWVLDVAFGGDGMTSPLPLVPDVVTRNLGTQEVRLVYGPIPDLVAPLVDQFWIYQYRNSPDQPWNSFYAFGYTEFLPANFYIINWYISRHPESFQRYTVLVVKFLRGDDEDVVGKVMLVNGDVKRNLGGKTEVVKSCETEEQRVQALKEWFGIDLLEEERVGIYGRPGELKREKMSMCVCI